MVRLLALVVHKNPVFQVVFPSCFSQSGLVDVREQDGLVYWLSFEKQQYVRVLEPRLHGDRLGGRDQQVFHLFEFKLGIENNAIKLLLLSLN